MRNWLYPFHLSLCLVLCLSTTVLMAQGYTVKDSIAIYHLLDQADDADLNGELGKAVQHVQAALKMSLQQNMPRGAGFAYLKLADLQLKKDGPGGGLDTLYEQAFRIGQRIQDNLLQGLSRHQRSQYLRDQNRHVAANNLLSEALVYYTAGAENNYVAIVYNDKGYIYEKTGKYDSAALMYLQAIRFFEKEGSLKGVANTTGNLAITRYRMGLKEEAIALFKSSAAMRESMGDVKGLAATYGNLVTAYSSIGPIDSAVHYQKKALANAKKSGVKGNLAQANSNTAGLLARQRKYAEALSFEKEAAQLYGEMGDSIKQAYRYLVIAGYHDRLNDSATAENIFSNVTKDAESWDNKPLLQSLYQARSDFYTLHGNNKAALDLYRKYMVVKDSLLNEKVLFNINELKEQYETGKKDNEIARLKTEQKIKDLEVEKQQALAAGNFLEAEKRKAQIELLQKEEEVRELLLQQKQEELTRQELLARESEQQMLQSVQSLQIAENEKKLQQRQLDRERLLRNGIIALAVSMLVIGALLFNRYQLRKKIQEQERLLAVRNKISKDLHDDIGSTLTSIHVMSMVSEQSMEADPENTRHMIREITEQSRTIQQNMSDIVWAIRPDNEKVQNLAARMREYAAQTLENLQVETSFEENEEVLSVSLPMEYRKELLLIYKEAINNIVKHAGARRVTISLAKSGNQWLLLQIEDNGRWKNNEYSTGTGTISMQQRAASLGGRVEVRGDSNGTTVAVYLPLP